MKCKLLVCFTMIFSAFNLAGLPASAGQESLGQFNPRGPDPTTIAGINRTPTAVGSMRPEGQHLVRPREHVVENQLRQERKIGPQTTMRQSRMAMDSYYKEFAKSSSTWVSSEVQERASAYQGAPMAAGLSATAVQPVTASILSLAVEFGGTDTFRPMVNLGTGCKRQDITTTGPLKGQIPQPGPRDNNTVWYSPQQTADAKFYEKLIFGYAGIGRVRPDMTDPTDKKPGINLAGYTVQDYYDHMAGAGNVAFSGFVKGWVTVEHSEGYYGSPNCANLKSDGGGPVPVAQLVVDTVDKFLEEHPEYYKDTTPSAFWPKFDANHDGVVDTFWIIHAGMGQEAGGGTQGQFAIWSHSYDLRKFDQWTNGYKVYEGDPNTTADDIVIGPYSVLPENVDLGVMIEELGHTLFGLPDLYTTDAENSIGFWSIMSNGTWTGWLGGATPVGMPLWMRMVARCGDDFCNWHQPLLTRAYDESPENVVVGQLEETPSGAYKGIRINLPDISADGKVYSQYYLVEWRSLTKYDKMLKTAYINSFADDDEWFVERVPYNIPGAVVYYCNNRYGLSKSIEGATFDPPGLGPKQQLLVVDMNYEALRRGDTGEVLSARAGSYDAALTKQQTKPFTIGTMDSEGNAAPGWVFPAKPAVKMFDDAKGYYAGFYSGAPCPDEEFCFTNQYGSTVIPARGNYSTRITHYDGTPYPELYGTIYADSDIVLGSGNPGDEGLQYGVTVGLVSRTDDNKMAVLRLNGPLSPELALSWVGGPPTAKAGDRILVSFTIANWGYEATPKFKVGLYLSTDQIINPKADLLLGNQTITSIGARKVLLQEKIVRIPTTVSPRNYYLGAFADVDNTVAETDETNNVLASNVIIQILPSDPVSILQSGAWQGSLLDFWRSLSLPRF
jgi:M6 family metalloprotease-like protein